MAERGEKSTGRGEIDKERERGGGREGQERKEKTVKEGDRNEREARR